MSTQYRAPTPNIKYRNRAPVKAAAILSQALRRYGLDKDIAKYQFVAHWAEIVGEEIAKRTKPDQIRGGVLVIRVNNSIWAQELSMRKEVILARLQSFAPEAGIVRDIQFLVAS